MGGALLSKSQREANGPEYLAATEAECEEEQAQLIVQMKEEITELHTQKKMG